MESINLIESFSEFKEVKNIDRATLMSIIEDVFRSMLLKKYVAESMNPVDRDFSQTSQGKC